MKKLICLLIFILTFSYSFAGYLGGGCMVYGDGGVRIKESNQSYNISYPECNNQYYFNIQYDMCSDAGVGNCHSYIKIFWNTYTKYDPWIFQYYGGPAAIDNVTKYVPKNQELSYFYLYYYALITVSTHNYCSTWVSVTW
jgi:hypothetical protein